MKESCKNTNSIWRETIHALKYISALAERIISLNGKIFTDSFAEGIEDKEDSVIYDMKKI